MSEPELTINGKTIDQNHTASPNLEIGKPEKEVLRIEIGKEAEYHCKIIGSFEIPLEDLDNKYRINNNPKS